MNTTDNELNDEASENGDSDWSEVAAPQLDDGDDEPRTISYAGIVPQRFDRDTAHYVAIEGSEETKGQRFEITQVPVVVGRSSKCSIIIPDGRVSSRHLQLCVIDDRLMVEDLNSSNGTFLNGNRITGPVEFTTSSVVQLGQHVLRHEYRSRSDVKRESHLSADLQKARSFIEALLPKPISEGPEKTGWHFVPCATLGGDAFGYHYLDQNRLAIYLLDVCGHGAGAAMLSVSAMNTIRRQSLPHVDFSEPVQVLQGLNDVFQMDDHDGMYFSIWYGVYDRQERRMTYGSAGHPPALLMSSQDKSLLRLGTKSMAIGIMPTCRIAREVVTVNRGDRLYLFSDGVFEIMTKDDREWSLEEFEQEVRSSGAPVVREAGNIYARVRDISKKQDLDDDFSLVVLDFQG